MNSTLPAPPLQAVTNFVIKKGWLGKGLLIFIGLLAAWKLGISLLVNPALFLQQVVNGLAAWFRLCADRPWLHDGLRYCPFNKLRPWRCIHGGFVYQLLWHHSISNQLLAIHAVPQHASFTGTGDWSRHGCNAVNGSLCTFGIYNRARRL
jgi:hypothetical protein